MNEGVQTIIYPVKDLAATKALFTAFLGEDPIADAPYYVGYKIAGQDVGLDPSGHSRGMTGPVPFWHVDDIEARLEALVGAGAEIVQKITDVSNGRLVASVKDADGNFIGLLQDPA